MATNSIVTLNVGGTLYTTSLNTLTKDPNTMLGVMFSGRHPLQADSCGHFFIDASGEMFRYILDFLRHNKLTLPTNFNSYNALLSEALFFQVISLSLLLICRKV